MLFETRDGGTNWRTISPDLTREEPGSSRQRRRSGRTEAQGAKQRGAIYALAPVVSRMRTPSGPAPTTAWCGSRAMPAKTGKTSLRRADAWSKITQISASHFDDDTAYVSVSRFRIDDLRPYIYRTHDGGKTWKQSRRPARRLAGEYGARRSACARACCLPGPRPRSGSRSMMATTGSRCS